MAHLSTTKEEIKTAIIEFIKNFHRKPVESATTEEKYQATVYALRNIIMDKWSKTHDEYYEKDVKIVYYLSMEFLMGRFFGNSILNLKIFDEVKEALDELDIDYNALEEAEPDPGLGNGGLGRLAACFLDSLSTMEYPAYGCGIRYQYGIFRQKIEDGYQVEYPDHWLKNGDPWCIKRNEYAIEVNFGGNVHAVKKEDGEYKFVQENCQTVIAVPYDYPVVGYGCNSSIELLCW